MSERPQIESPRNVRKEFPERFMILFASAGTGGEERFLVELAVAMQRTVTKPVVINLKATTPYQADLERHSVTLLSSIAPWRFSLVGAMRLFRLILRLNPDVLLVNSNRQSMWLGCVLGVICRVPVMLIHTHDHLAKNAFTLRRGSAIADRVIAAAETHCEALCEKQGLKPSQVAIVSPGIDLTRTARMPQSESEKSPIRETRVVGIIAGLRPEKDHETFLRAAAFVLQRVQHVQFHVIGDGPERPRLQRLAEEFGISGSIHFLGWQEVNGRLFRSLDILVLSSISETFPAVLLEALSAEVPVVATAVGSVAELLGSPPSGLIVPPRDPEALASALIRILQEDKFAQTLIELGRKRVRFFSADRFCSDMLRLAREIHESKIRAGER